MSETHEVEGRVSGVQQHTVSDVLAGSDGMLRQTSDLKKGEPSSYRKNAQVRATIAKIFKDNNYDPFVEMVKIAKDVETPLKIRAFLACELGQYLAPKLKSIDLDANVSGDFRVFIKQFGQAIQGEALQAASVDEPRLIELDPLSKSVGV